MTSNSNARERALGTGVRRWLVLGATAALASASVDACSGDSRRRVLPEDDAGATAGGAEERAGSGAGGSAGTTTEGGGDDSAAAGTDGGAGGNGGSVSGAGGEGPADPPDCLPPPADGTLSAATEGIPEAGLKLWLRADVGLVLDAQNRICRWQDQSGNGNDVRQADPPSRPKAGATLGGKPAIDVDPNQTLLRDDVLGIAAKSGRSIVAVYALNSAGTRFTIYQGDRTTNWAYVGLDDNTFMTIGDRFGCYITSQSYDGDAVTDTVPHVRAFVADSLQPGLSVLSNLHCLKDAQPLALTYRCCEPSQLIGDLSTANTTFVPAGGDAYLAEVLFYDRALSPTVLSQLQSTLAARYGITISD